MGLLALACVAPVVHDSGSLDTGASFDDHPLMQPGLLNVAHRGGGRLMPEHTLEAYANALDVGADVLECDVQTTADGVLVCIHDTTVDRTTDGTGAVNDLTFAELQELDAADLWDEHRGQGFTVPSFESALQTHPGALWVVEIKQHTPSLVPQLLELLEAHDQLERTAVMSFFQLPIDEVRQDPRVLTAMTLTEAYDWLDGGAPAAPHAHVPLEQGDVTLDTELVDRAHDDGVQVWIWTLNTDEELETGIELGADAIFTDDPARLATHLGG
ncbi:MAG: hypothetical protein GY913_22160 [Proteobacteria bacterium]|nr:hypothetical protein [Pseudomonadota bacterium]MCP4919616.1 hypothetical protein [Pseudomonadota bacterium]